MMGYIAWILMVVIGSLCSGQDGEDALLGTPDRLLPVATHRLKVEEPSDLCLTPAGDGFFMVGDEGRLHRVDMEGNILQTARGKGLDYEGVFAEGKYVYVMEEMTRRVVVYDADSLVRMRNVHVPYGGGRNKAYESLTYNPVRKCYVTVTERDPVRIVELDEGFREIGDFAFKRVTDISGATYANGMVWLLSDEDATVFALDAGTYAVRGQWRIKVLNAEGIAVAGKRMFVVSDDMGVLYEFELPNL